VSQARSISTGRRGGGDLGQPLRRTAAPEAG
jgi:hypothetical protein